MIDRRTTLASLGAMFGTALFAPIVRAATATQPLQGAVGAPVFTSAQKAIVSALGERVVPTTDTPGAIAAGVPAFIEQLLGEWGLPGDVAPIAAGLAAIDARSRLDYGVGAAHASAVQQDALLTLAMNRALPGVEGFSTRSGNSSSPDITRRRSGSRRSENFSRSRDPMTAPIRSRKSTRSGLPDCARNAKISERKTCHDGHQQVRRDRDRLRRQRRLGRQGTHGERAARPDARSRHHGRAR
ncbi:gluconate 2-dehydrogenase subunit 3 family protein [Sphingomonas sp. 7/4-4]|uniref:gluconate 2-dehydrogenase subunit 3 family protein n=1 Tax=Sphingomonas sp. 7/4-4 TaxID=3018446 RepID=UPI0022F3A754|nr:gluconate 2-dehydrogenase subunit 3 family protein [Sphingomonas sp. 7/4-4]WBY07979.1 gluconate 2-dehydrogenase subunit 3 family protein [Sphingomonas sp. 7/4-4]